MSSININGKSFTGRSVVVTNNRVIINGVDVTPEDKDSKIININVVGDLDEINADCCNKIVITGNANIVTTTSGDVDCNNVNGDVRTTSGDIECGNVGGNIQTVSGDVKCENVTGNVKTVSGDIKNRK